jgi:Asp-tRNA(Asn)/Glu-tRNA(Gln) amidotransferase A subunit family amidase
VPDALHGKRLGLLIKAGDEDLAPTTPDARRVLAEAAARLRRAGAEIVDGIAIDGFDPKLGPAFVAGSAPRIDAMLAAYPAARRDWRDVCASGRIPPDWTRDECLSLAGPDAEAEASARRQIDANRGLVIALLDRLDLDGLVYLTDRRGGARVDETDGFTCFVASTSGLPAIAIPAGLDGEGMPVGVEILGRPGSDEALVAMAAALEQVRGPLPAAPKPAANPALATLGIAGQNSLRVFLGWSAFKSRKGEDLGDLEAGRFRALVEGAIDGWPPGEP